MQSVSNSSLAFQLATAVVASTIAGVAVPAVAANSVERIGDWEIICGDKADNSKTKARCRMIQNHAAKVADGRTGGTVLLVTILPRPTGKRKGPPVAIVSVPQGVYLVPGIAMDIDGKQKFKLLYETCNASGCHAGFKVAGKIANAFRRGAVARHVVHNHRQMPVTINVSLKGFTKALQRLSEVSR